MISYLKKLFPFLNFVSDDILKNTNEIRVRVNRPIVLYGGFGMYVLDNSIVSYKALQEVFKKLCDYSVYSRENEIKNGFITLSGLGRVGICADAVIKEDKISSLKNITSLNFRISREYKGFAEKHLKVLQSGSVLVAGKSGCGKTTFLRDAARLISKNGKKVTVIDERNEIAGMNQGQALFDIGFCDVLSSFPKKEGMIYAIRTLSPEVIICDEIGEENEAKAVSSCMYAGANVLISVHLEKIEDVFKRKVSSLLLKTNGFRNVIFISDFNAKVYKTEELYENYGRASSCGGKSAFWNYKSEKSFIQSLYY